MSNPSTRGAPLEGEVALVTGASRGIGAAIAAALADEGTKVVALSSADGDLSDPDVPGRLWQESLARLDGRIPFGGSL